MENQKKYMKISELSKRSGIPRPKIRQYIAHGLVSKPIKTGKTLAYYTNQHLDRLKLIQEMDKEKLPITILNSLIDSVTKIKEGEKNGKAELPQKTKNQVLLFKNIIDSVADVESRLTKNQVLLYKKIIDSVADVEGCFQKETVDPARVVRDQIIETSIPIFRKKGYEKTTIADIANAAGIGRNTFYQHFKNKKELFIVCLDAIFLNVRKDVNEDEDHPVKVEKRSWAFYRAYPQWSDMMNLLRASAVKYPEDFADRLEEALDVRIRPIIDDNKKAVAQGLIREVDLDILAILSAGAFDYLCYYMYRGKFGKRKPDEIFKLTDDIFMNGLRGDR